MRTSVGVTLGNGTALIITDDESLAIHDYKTNKYSVIGPATKETIESLKYAIERLEIHTP